MKNVECLRCGALREVEHESGRLEPGECSRCGYVGWAMSIDLTEALRRKIRDIPLNRRARLLVV